MGRNPTVVVPGVGTCTVVVPGGSRGANFTVSVTDVWAYQDRNASAERLAKKLLERHRAFGVLRLWMIRVIVVFISSSGSVLAGIWVDNALKPYEMVLLGKVALRVLVWGMVLTPFVVMWAVYVNRLRKRYDKIAQVMKVLSDDAVLD